MAPTLYGLIRSINILSESLGRSLSLISVLLKRLRFVFFLRPLLLKCRFSSGEKNKARSGSLVEMRRLATKWDAPLALFLNARLRQGFLSQRTFGLTDNSHGKQRPRGERVARVAASPPLEVGSSLFLRWEKHSPSFVLLPRAEWILGCTYLMYLFSSLGGVLREGWGGGGGVISCILTAMQGY